MTQFSTKRVLLAMIITAISSALLISLSNYIHNSTIAVALLVICVLLAPVLFVPLFYFKHISKIFLCLLPVIYIVFLLELLSRILIPDKSQFERGILGDARKPYPYIEFKGDSLFNRIIGYPDKAAMQKKGPAEYRIFLLGGSTVTGGAPPISNIIQAEFLRRGYPNVHVYNMGVISSNANMELARVVYEVSDFSPDLIVFYNGGNDMMLPLHGDPRPGYPFNFLIRENNILYDTNDYPIWPLIAYQSNLFRVLFRSKLPDLFGKQEELRRRANYRAESWENEIAGQYVSALIKTDKVAKAFGAEFAAFLQPTIYYKNICSDREKELKNNDGYKYEEDLNKKLREKIRQEVTVSGLANFYDLTNSYENDPNDYFIDWIHTNQAAIQIVAERMFMEISNRFKIPKPDSTADITKNI